MKLALRTVITLALLGSYFGLQAQEDRSVSRTKSPTDSSKPRLAVVIVLEQMRPDQLTRLDRLFTGGLRRLSDHGYLFLNGYHNHTQTESVVGHAVIATGAYPARNGITGTSWYDVNLKREVYCVEDSTSTIIGKPGLLGRSPVSLKAMTLGDWVVTDSRDSKVISVAINDDAAVAMAGFRAERAFWYDSRTGEFVTSLYYGSDYPDWFEEINDPRLSDQYFLGVWEKLLPDTVYLEPEAGGSVAAFRHNFLPAKNEEPATYYSHLLNTPFSDHMVFELAKSCILHERMGADDVVDLLWISCSAVGSIGSTYGPFSYEAQDYFLRLDVYLENFFRYLDSHVGEESYVVALTSARGVAPIPGNLQDRGIATGHLSSDSVRADIAAIGEEVAAELGLPGSPVLDFERGIHLNEPVITSVRADQRRVEIELANRLRKLAYVEDVFTSNELTDRVAWRPYLELYRNGYCEGRSPDIALRFPEYLVVMAEDRGATQGSCYPYDTDVPIIFYGSGIPAGHSDDRVETAAIAPTIGELIGFSARREIDGNSVVNYFNSDR